MTAFFRSYGYGVGMVLFLICLCAGVAIHPVSGAGTSDTYEGYLGDTINLHGVSYVGSQIYLFFTGPNLMTNWVTLLNPALRADQGYFTIVDVDSDQQWSMKWNTARIENQIDPGTYTVYVVTAPRWIAPVLQVPVTKLLRYISKMPGRPISTPAGSCIPFNPRNIHQLLLQLLPP